jgi:AhpD family alkylhydroperoxidase
MRRSGGLTGAKAHAAAAAALLLCACAACAEEALLQTARAAFEDGQYRLAEARLEQYLAGADRDVPPGDLVASAVLRCNDCIDYHLIECAKAGCTEEEILDALNVALVVGGSVVIPHLRHAYETVEMLRRE